MDLVLDCIPSISKAGRTLPCWAAATRRSSARSSRRRARIRGRVAVHVGYDEASAHLMQGGPTPSGAVAIRACGLTQMCALAVRRTARRFARGRLADTVVDVAGEDTRRASGPAFRSCR
jgi:starch synthase